MRERFDVVCYAPWASRLLGSTRAGGAGGGETQMLLLARGLAARGLRGALIAIGDEDDLPESVDGVRIVRQAPRRRTRGLLGRAGLALAAFRSLAGVRGRVVLQMNAGPTTAVAALAARLRGARFVYMAMNVIDFALEDWEPRKLNVNLYRWAVRRASGIVVQTDEQQVLCRTRFERDSVVIRSIASRERPRTAEPEAFLWVGRMKREKHPDAYLDLARAMPDVPFWMIAVPRWDDPPELRSRIEEAAELLPNLELLEPRSRAGVGELLDRSVAIVSTSVAEGMPNVFLEAWSRGVPALSLSFDPDGLIARHGLGEFAEGDFPRFEEQARRLWRERSDQAEVAARCIGFMAAEHDEDVIVDRWMRALALP